LRAHKGTGVTVGTVPYGFRPEKPVLETHFDHVDNSSRVKGGLSLTDRAYTCTCATVKTSVDHLAARHGGHLKFELMLKIVLGDSQSILLFVEYDVFD
jgi:hypothetical protein